MNVQLRLLFIALALCMAGLNAVDNSHYLKNDNQFVKVSIKALSNATSHDISIENLESPADEVVKLKRALEIPFISISTYLKEYAAKKAFTPEAALTISTQQGAYRLWASESGIMFARDPKNLKLALDAWKAKKILGNTKTDHPGKTAYVGTLIFKMLNNKLKVSLEPAAS